MELETQHEGGRRREPSAGPLQEQGVLAFLQGGDDSLVEMQPQGKQVAPEESGIG